MKESFLTLSLVVVLAVVFVALVFIPPYEVRMQRKADKNWYMPNDAIISETRKCEDAGLSAKEETRYLNSKLQWRIIGITCRPLREDTKTSQQKIKKSNITTINIDKAL